MTGLDLETFLRLLRADLGGWITLGLGGIGLALLVWSSWGSRRILRKCLVLSLAVHLGVVIYGSTVPAVRKIVRGGLSDPSERDHIKRIRVAPVTGLGGSGSSSGSGASASVSTAVRLALGASSPKLLDRPLRVERPKMPEPLRPATARLRIGPSLAMATATPRPARPGPDPPAPSARPDPSSNAEAPPPAPPTPAPADRAELDRLTDVPSGPRDPISPDGDRPPGRRPGPIERALGSSNRSLRADVRPHPHPRPSLNRNLGPSPRRAATAPDLSPVAAIRNPDAGPGRTGPTIAAASPDQGPSGRPGSGATGDPGPAPAPTGPGTSSLGSRDPLILEHVTPPSRTGESSSSPRLAALAERPPITIRAPADVPRVYRPRVEPNRSVRARRAGASVASELAVERALDWLARHQDDDGRWNAGTARFDNGTAVDGDTSFTAHCPPGDVCWGESRYWEADTALTGLALLSYLGAGHTHVRGRYAGTVARGLDFLIASQKKNGDLRGDSTKVGMYCHAMATLALCEGYALTGDERLRDPATRAVAWLVRSRARDGMAWRYNPGEEIGDTSILGWVVMSLKSAREAGLPIPNENSARQGALKWLDRVAMGADRGLACYQPDVGATPTMTAEAWVCRQFLDAGGPGPASDEAADFLVHHESDRPREKGKPNYYYWYYATLALYQDGGSSWTRWNARMRDRIVALQKTEGHRAGSWDPDPDGSQYEAMGGRIFCTTLATMTLEVYYRYLRLYDDSRSSVPPLEAARPADGVRSQGPPLAPAPSRRRPAALNPEDL